MVTAELAVGLPSLALILVAAVTVIAAVGAQLRCTDAAAGAARLAARGQPVTAYVAADAPPGAQVATTTSAGLVTATVSAELRLPMFGWSIPIDVAAMAVQPLEPGIAPPGPGPSGIPISAPTPVSSTALSPTAGPLPAPS